MTSYRPPLGGLFRLSGPHGRPPARDAARGARADEARDAIRHFVRVLERLDRDVALGARLDRDAPAHPRSAPRAGRSKSR